MQTNNSQPKSENINFSVHQAILDSVISAQSGTLHKALIELVMNGIDAGASEVRVKLHNNGFEVADDGRGFTDREQIMTCFAQFGSPQTEDKTFGRFRIGRGQCFMWGETSWRSGQFKMVVDTRNKGLTFDLHEDHEPIKGCTVSGDFYDKLDMWDLSECTRSFKTAVKFVSVPVFLNDVQINVLPPTRQWKYETDDAYIDIESTTWGTLDVYNQGIHCLSFKPSVFGVSGIIVTKHALTVNFARNDILVNQCPVWKRISTYVKKVSTDRLLSKKSLTNAEQDSLATRFLNKEFNYLQIRNSPLLTDITGANVSFPLLLKSKSITVCWERKSVVADQVQTSKMARVLTPETLRRFDCTSIEDFANNLYEWVEAAAIYGDLDSKTKQMLANDLNAIGDALWSEDVESFAHYFNNGFTTLEDKDLSAEELYALQSIRKGDRYVRRVISESCAIPYEVLPRKLLAGKSDSQAWTDGSSFICINRERLKMCSRGIEQFLYICQLLAHEYLHVEDDCHGHDHDAIFHEAYHRASMHVGSIKGINDLYAAADAMAKYYTEILYKNKTSIPQGFAKYGGLTADCLKILNSRCWDLRSALTDHKLQGPFVEDRERLVFARHTIGSEDLVFRMTEAGPVTEYGEKVLHWADSYRWTFHRGYHHRNGEILTRWSLNICDCEALKVALSATNHEAVIALFDRLALRPYQGQITDDTQKITIGHFHETRIFQEDLRAWVEREPLLAERCAKSAEYCKDWLTRLRKNQ